VPGLPLRGQSPEEARRDIALLVQEAGCPVNVLASAALPPVSVLRELGVRRMSVGSSVMRLAYAAARDSATRIITTGELDSLTLAGTLPLGEVNRMLALAE
jgi:2-methylisocitrate lyase-like PEP mutase family enzyme